MKRKIFSIICLMLAIIPCLTLVACKKADKVEGTYSVTSASVTYDGISYSMTKDEYTTLSNKETLTEDEEMQLMMMGTFFGVSIEIKEDGTCLQTMTYEGETETMTGTWSLDGEDLTLTSDDGDEMVLKYSDGKLTMSEEDEGSTMTVVFEK